MVMMACDTQFLYKLLNFSKKYVKVAEATKH